MAEIYQPGNRGGPGGGPGGSGQLTGQASQAGPADAFNSQGPAAQEPTRAPESAGPVKPSKSATWHGDGIYSKPRIDRDGRPYRAFFVRMWIPSEKRARYFKGGRTLPSARRLRLRLLADPDRAV